MWSYLTYHMCQMNDDQFSQWFFLVFLQHKFNEAMLMIDEFK